jgi:hypothetical protein
MCNHCDCQNFELMMKKKLFEFECEKDYKFKKYIIKNRQILNQIVDLIGELKTKIQNINVKLKVISDPVDDKRPEDPVSID